LNTLIVVAHPDDEVLGAGASAARWCSEGHQVTACILSGEVVARRNRPELSVLRENTREASKLLGMGAPIMGTFPNLAFNTVPHLDLVRFIESAIEETAATRIITHHVNDLNDDHLHTSRACQAAARLFQRRDGTPPLEELLLMEVPSSTDWAFPSSTVVFNPNTFVAVDDEQFERKISSLSCYSGVMRVPPHPRSYEALRSLAITRGSQAGVKLAEGFVALYRRT
jgi:LmbE family N-acetylglucosaminyl deacetylase